MKAPWVKREHRNKSEIITAKAELGEQKEEIRLFDQESLKKATMI